MNSDVNQSSNGHFIYLIFTSYNALKPANTKTKQTAGCHFRQHTKTKQRRKCKALYRWKQSNIKMFSWAMIYTDSFVGWRLGIV